MQFLIQFVIYAVLSPQTSQNVKSGSIGFLLRIGLTNDWRKGACCNWKGHNSDYHRDHGKDPLWHIGREEISVANCRNGSESEVIRDYVQIEMVFKVEVKVTHPTALTRTLNIIGRLSFVNQYCQEYPNTGESMHEQNWKDSKDDQPFNSNIHVWLLLNLLSQLLLFLRNLSHSCQSEQFDKSCNACNFEEWKNLRNRSIISLG